jgi:coenzyme F420 hydrogenase subunit beta
MNPQPSNNRHAERLQERVVDGGYCIGCGACAALPDSPMRIVLDNDGKLQASLKKKQGSKKVNVCAVCPYSGEADNENIIAKSIFGTSKNYAKEIGQYNSLYAGYVLQNEQRIASASGGLITWLLVRLLKEKKVDGIVHVRPCVATKENPLVLKYAISKTEEEIRSGVGSHYYPIELSEVLQEIRNTEGRYAVVGIPKFITAVRLLMKQDPIFKERIVYCVGIVAGHMKSKHYADSIAWDQGIDPEKLTGIQFRLKKPDRTARNGYIGVQGISGKDVVDKTLYAKQQFGKNNWGLKFFEYEAADFSDDLMAETADITFGDAWISRYAKNWRGTSLVIARNVELEKMLIEGEKEQQIQIDELSPEEVVQSQSAGLRHAREGTALRIHTKTSQGVWCPSMRFPINIDSIPLCFHNIIAARSRIAVQSFLGYRKAKDQNDYTIYTNAMAPLLKQYYKQRPLWYRIASWLQRHVPFL